jgi:hypothetical protein
VEGADGGALRVRGVWPASNCQQRLLLHVPVVAVALPFPAPGLRFAQIAVQSCEPLLF